MAEAFACGNDPESLVLRYLETRREDLKDMILMQCASMVERVARRFSGIEPLEDLVQVGFIGLLNALSKFDANAGVRFTTYATHLVAGEIKHYLRDRSQTIRQPAWLQELRHKVSKSATSLQITLGRQPSEREIADELGVSEAAILEVFQTQELLKVASLDQPAGGDDESLSETETLDAPCTNGEQLSVEDRVVLEDAIKQLRDLEREVLIAFHFDALNQTEIAHKLGISCNYVSHILRQSLTKLRRILAQEEEKERVLKRQAESIDEGVLDPLTGVYSEDYFIGRLAEEVHRGTDGESVFSLLTVFFEDVDKLGSFYGEESVRDFMAEASEVLRGSVRRLDVLCRNGEYGFAIILRAVGSNVLAVRERITQALNSWLSARAVPSGPIVAHLGQAAYPENGRTSAELLGAAEPIAPCARTLDPYGLRQSA